MKIHTNELGHMTNISTMPIYGKHLKNLLLQNQWSMTFVNVASRREVLPKLFKL